MARRDWYCQDVLSGKLEVQRIYEDDLVLAFHHPHPVAELHVVVIPKAHVPSILDEGAKDGDLLVSMVRGVQAASANAVLPEGAGFYVRTNVGAPGVTPHMHWHVIGPGAGENWPKS